METMLTRRSAVKIMGAALLCMAVSGTLISCSSGTTWYNFESQNNKRQANKLVFDVSAGTFSYYKESEKYLYGNYSVSGSTYTFVDTSSKYREKYTGQLKDGDLYAFNRIWHKSEQEAVQAYNVGVISYH